MVIFVALIIAAVLASLFIPSWLLLVFTIAADGMNAFNLDLGIDLFPWRIIFPIFFLRIVITHRLKQAQYQNLLSAALPVIGIMVIGAFSELINLFSLQTSPHLGSLRNPAVGGLLELLQWSAVYLWYLVLLAFLDDFQLVGRVVCALLLFALSLAGFGLLQFAGVYLGLPVPVRWNASDLPMVGTAIGAIPRVGSFTGEPKDLAHFLMPLLVALPLLLSSRAFRQQRLIGSIVFGVLALTFFLTFTRTYTWVLLVGYGTVFPFWFWVLNRGSARALGSIWKFGIVGIGVAGGVVIIFEYFELFSFSDVINLFITAPAVFFDPYYRPWVQVRTELELFESSPIIGVGPGQAIWHFLGRYGDIFGMDKFSIPINWYIGTLSEVGLLGFGALMWLLYDAFRRFTTRLRACMSLKARTVGVAMMGSASVLLISHLYDGGPAIRTMLYLALGQAAVVRQPAVETRQEGPGKA